MRRNWSRLLAVGGGVALMALIACPTAEARRGGGGSSPFVKTPYGYVPKSQMYGQYMTPGALQKALQAEKSAYDKMQKATGQSTSTDSKKKSSSDPKKKK